MNSIHKAPFDRDGVVIPPSASKALAKRASASTPNWTGSGTNVMVNQDRNPWPKAELGAAVDPTNGNNYVVMANDFRENYDHEFYHVSTNGGATFTTQKAVSDTSFNPCVGFPGCGFFGDYTQLVSGPDNVVRAAWSDTRDGASMQIWSQAVTW